MSAVTKIENQDYLFLKRFIVVQMFCNFDGSPSGSGHRSRLLDFRQASIQYRQARDFREKSESKGGVYPTKVFIVRLSLDQIKLIDFDLYHVSPLSLNDIFFMRPQVSSSGLVL